MAYLSEIVAGRRRRVAAEGAELGEAVPGSRRQPLVPLVPRPLAGGRAGEAEGRAESPRGTAAAGGRRPDGRPGRAAARAAGGGPLLICEIKRRSPSRGAIAPGLDAAAQARRYAAAGVRAVSVLTEPDHFGGALADLVAVKEACPHLSVLRKDFLLDERDLDVSHRAGADAVLLLAACLTVEELGRLYRRTLELGMTPLVEVHDAADLARARAVRPLLTGINSRDLTTFEVDTTLPARLRPAVDWPTTLLFESGIHCAEDAAFARSAGFDGVLVGEAVVRRPELVAELRAVLTAPAGAGAPPPEGGRVPFWARVFAARHRLAGSGRPMIKVCGITNRADAELAVELGADLLGFIMAPAPRRARMQAIRALADLPVLKVGVVVNDVSEALPLLRDGCLDALQLHGDEAPGECYEIAFPYYKAVRAGTPADLEAESAYRCPRVLLDAYSPAARGGTGQRVADDLLARRAAAEGVRPLWLAGGMGPDNVAAVIRTHAPELIDASSRLEAEPGRKDHARLRAFFHAVEAARDHGAAGVAGPTGPRGPAGVTDPGSRAGAIGSIGPLRASGPPDRRRPAGAASRPSPAKDTTGRSE